MIFERGYLNVIDVEKRWERLREDYGKGQVVRKSMYQWFLREYIKMGRKGEIGLWERSSSKNIDNLDVHC